MLHTRSGGGALMSSVRFDQCIEKLRKFFQNLNTAFLSWYDDDDWLWRVQKGGKEFQKFPAFAFGYVILVKYF